jgi:hypothetical protein
MDWFWKSIAGATVSFFWKTWVLPAILPLGAALITALLGWIAEPAIPIIYVWVCMLAAFSFTASGSQRFVEWQEKRKIKDKLSFAQVSVAVSIHHDAFSLRVHLQSTANFPIEFEVVEFKTQIANRVPSQTYSGITVFEIPSNGIGWFSGELINVADIIPKQNSLIGILQFEFKYGRPGKRRYVLKGKKNIVLPFDQGGNLLPNGAVNDIK